MQVIGARLGADHLRNRVGNEDYFMYLYGFSSI